MLHHFVAPSLPHLLALLQRIPSVDFPLSNGFGIDKPFIAGMFKYNAENNPPYARSIRRINCFTDDAILRFLFFLTCRLIQTHFR